VIPFRHIPANLRVPGTYFEFDPSGANTAQEQLRTLIIGQVLAGAPYAASGIIGTPQGPSLGAADAAANAGYGSMLHLMVSDYRSLDSFSELWVLPLADDGAATAATGTHTFTGPATANGTLPLYINGVSVPVLVTSGMTATQIAAAVVAAVSALPNLPVTAANAAGVVTYTAKNKGLAGNDIDLRFAYRGALNGEAIPAGVGATPLTPTILTGGATNPSLTTPLLNLADMRFEVIVCPFTDTTSLNSLQSFMDDATGRWSWQRKLYGHVYSARNNSLSNAVTFGTSRNDPAMTVLPIDGSPLWPPQIAAQVAAVAMNSVQADPALPIQFIPTNIPPPVQQKRFVVSDRQALLFDGLSTYKVVSGVLEIERLVTTYQLNTGGVPDTSYLNVELRHTLGFVARSLDTFLTTRFLAARVKLATDGTRVPGGSGIVTPSVIKASFDTEYRRLCEVVGVCQDADGFARESRVELAGLGRVNIQAPVRVMGQLRILALSVNFQQPS
jgi:phage tail sheath gpL-like